MRRSSTRPKTRLCLAIIAGIALYGILPAVAQTTQPTSQPNRPTYQVGSAGRFNEDWSTLRGVDLSTTDDFWDRVKFIPLTPDQRVWLTLGGQARERFEYFRQFHFGESEPKQCDGYLLSRRRDRCVHHLQLHPSPAWLCGL
jgi:hypothetical protein